MSELPKYELPDPQLVIPLDAPIVRQGGGEVTEITLHEPKASDVRKAETHLRSGVNPLSLREYQMALVTSVSGLSRAVIEELPVSKLMEAAEYLQDFITPGLATGQN